MGKISGVGRHETSWTAVSGEDGSNFAAPQPEAPKLASPAGPISSNIGAKRISHNPKLVQRESHVPKTHLELTTSLYTARADHPNSTHYVHAYPTNITYLKSKEMPKSKTSGYTKII